MANNQSPGGLSPVCKLDGSPYDGAGRPYYIAASQTTFGVGALVAVAGTSNTAAITASGGRVMGAMGYPIGSLQTVALCADGAVTPTGVVVGFGMDPSKAGKGPSYYDGNTAAVVFVEDSLNVMYEVMSSDAVGSVLASTTVGDVANIVGGGSPSSATGRDGGKLNAATVASSGDSTYSLRIVGVSRALDRGDLTSPNASLYVALNNSTNALAQSGI
jgi:hypothetical protein